MAAKDKKQIVVKDDSTKGEISRRFHQHPLVFIGTFVVLVLVVVSFVLLPAMAPKAGSTDHLVFGSYDGKAIDYAPGNYFASQRDYYNQQLRQTGKDDNVQFVAYQIWRAAFESTAVHTAILAELENSGYSVPAGLVDRRMAENPAFLEDGKFSAAKYRAISESERFDLRESLKSDIAVGRYTEDVLDLRIPQAERDFVKTMSGPQRSFEYAALPLDSYPASEIAAFLSANPALFQTIKLSQISSAKEGDAKKLRDQIAGGKAKFEDIAKAKSKDAYAEKAGDLGVKYAYELKTAIADEAARAAVLKLAKGALSEPVKAGDYWVFFRCDEAAKASDAADPAILARAKEYLFSFERGKVEDYLTAKAGALAAAAEKGNFATLATAQGSSVKKFGPIALNFGDIEIFRSVASQKNAELAGASSSEAFWKAAFETKVGGFTKPLVLGDRVVVLKVLEEKAADESSAQIIDYYYPYVISQYSERALRVHFLQSKKLKDDFFPVFSKHIMAF